MTYSPVIYDWRTDVQPIDQFFRAGGVSIQSGMTLGGASVENPEPGGRGELLLRFPMLALDSANRQASWTLSRMLNGNIMRIPLYSPTVQMIPDADIGTSVTAPTWTNTTWTNTTWASDPLATVYATAAKGASVIQVDMSTFGRVAKNGHVIGFGQVTHIILDITYTAANIATITIAPPLRKARNTTDVCKFRPVMIATCTNAREVADNFRNGRNMAMNPARFVEALV